MCDYNVKYNNELSCKRYAKYIDIKWLCIYCLYVHAVFVQSMSNCADASVDKEHPMDSNN